VNRKNTILLAVLINAGLLLVLFVTALTTQEEIAIAPTHEMSVAPKQEPPLFGDELDLTLRQPVPVTSVVAELPQVLPAETAPVVHALPPQESAAVAPAPQMAAPSLNEVVVKKGDTLEKIAKAHSTTVDEIIKLNQLPSSFLRVGQLLRMPAANVQKAVVKTPAAETGPDYYTVKVGDNPWTIAMKNHIKVEELLKLNALNEEKARKLKAGDRLRIR